MKQSAHVRVNLDERSYDIVIGENLLSSVPSFLTSLQLKPPFFIITDETVAELYLNEWRNVFAMKGLTVPVIVAPGEQSKNFSTLEKVLNAILAARPERKCTLIALGGGVIGDLTGFAASILLRGVSFIQIPTTLLAQVDSSVGGKTGINTPFGKNLVGSFYQPKLVIADIGMLATLPHRELLAGYAEVVKYGLIDNPNFFEWLEGQVENIKAGDKATLAHCVKTSCESKAAIVAADEREGGVRALLNLGHTFGHALEAETGFSDKLLHGEGVAIGMIMAFALSVRMGWCKEEDLERVRAHFIKVGLPTSLQDIQHEWHAEALLSHMYQDKKIEDGKLVFILTKGIGKAFIAKDVEAVAVLTMLRDII